VEADGQLAYLDILLTKTETGSESTTVPTGKTLIQDCTINGKACRHYSTKKTVIQSLLHRSYEICSSCQLIHK